MATGLWPETETALVPGSMFEPQVNGILPHVAWQKDPVGWAEHYLLIPRHTLIWSLNAGYGRYTWDGTPDPLAMAFRALADWRDVAISSGTGVGKSFGAAIAVLWFLACWENARVYTYALNEDQLKLYIWANIAELFPRFQAHFPTAELTDLTIRMRGGTDQTWAANGRSVLLKAGETVSSRAQGAHAEHMLLVYEEAAAMAWPIIEAGRQTCTRPHNNRLFIANPISQTDSVARVSRQRGVVPIRASALDHPNIVSGNPDVVPGTLSQKSIDDRLSDCQGNTNDPIYLSRVRGIAPEQASNSLIRLEWLKASALRYKLRRALTDAMKRGDVIGRDWLSNLPHHLAIETPANAVLDLQGYEATEDDDGMAEWERSRSVGRRLSQHADSNAPQKIAPDAFVIRPIGRRITGKGVDAANSDHGDEASICDFAGNAVVRHDHFPCPNAGLLGAQVRSEMLDAGDGSTMPDERVGVDATGVGSSTVNELLRTGRVVQVIHFGTPAQKQIEKSPDGELSEWSPDVNLFATSGGLRSQMYWQLRLDFQRGLIDVDGEIGCTLWEELTAHTFTDFPKTVVCPKDDVKALLGRSPNEAESLVIANWVRARAVVPTVSDVAVGKSPGWDPATQKARKRETGQEYIDRISGEGYDDTRADRYAVPYRERGSPR